MAQTWSIHISECDLCLFVKCHLFLPVLSPNIHVRQKNTYSKIIYKVNYIFTTGFLQLIGNEYWFQFLHLIYVYNLAIFVTLLNIPYTTKQKALPVQVQYISIYNNPAWWGVGSQVALSDRF